MKQKELTKSFMTFSNCGLYRLYNGLTFILVTWSIQILLCLATAIHNLKWLKITQICLIWEKTFTNLDV